MSDTPTPETDKLILDWYCNLTGLPNFVDIARKFERERDEAIRQRNETNESSKYAVDYAMRERDEAIRQLENIKASSIHTCHDQCQRPMCVLRRERDEARERERIAALVHKALYDTVEHERDEAREALKKCREDSICYAEHMRRCGYVAAYKESTENAEIATIILNKLKEGGK
jgi:hypothetical protein